MIDQPGSPDPTQRVTGLVRLAGTLRASPWTIAGVGVAVLVGALVVRELGAAGVKPTASPSPGASAIGSAVPSAEASAEPTPEPSSPSPTTPLPSATMTGELPEPGATIHPGIPVIAGLRFDDLAATTGPLGLACESYRNPTGSYHLVCEATDPSSNASYTVEAEYWTLDSVTALYISIISIDIDRPVSDPTAVRRLLLPMASLVGGEARAWVESHLDDPACSGNGCEGTFDGFGLEIAIASDGYGWGSLNIAGQ
jgi:hypothetical protein